ncbi:MAG: hypothetical protein PHD43_04510 [Methylococcales bacterium]|nr:hypothetical protein [Methylococcales bacterium]
MKLARHLYVSCDTAWGIKHNLMQVMLEHERQRPVEFALTLMMRTGAKSMRASADAETKIKKVLSCGGRNN